MYVTFWSSFENIACSVCCFRSCLKWSGISRSLFCLLIILKKNSKWFLRRQVPWNTCSWICMYPWLPTGSGDERWWDKVPGETHRSEEITARPIWLVEKSPERCQSCRKYQVHTVYMLKYFKIHSFANVFIFPLMHK